MYYVLKFKDRLDKVCNLAKENLKLAQEKITTWYDKKARIIVFKPRYKVLVLFPVQTFFFIARLHDPYEIMTKINEVDYVVKTSDRRRPTQLCHVNMIKPYYERKTVNVNVVVDEEESDLMEVMVNNSFESHYKHAVVSVRLLNSSIFENIDEKLAHLHPEQKKKTNGAIDF